MKQEDVDPVAEFGRNIGSHFDRLVFAFVCGSVARGLASTKSDVDMFVAVEGTSGREIDAFEAWYKDIHHRCGLAPDLDFPGEIVPVARLRARMQLAECSRPRRILRERRVYDGLVWSGMLASQPIVAFVGDRRRYELIAHHARQVCSLWTQALGPACDQTLPVDLALKEAVHITSRPSRKSGGTIQTVRPHRKGSANLA